MAYEKIAFCKLVSTDWWSLAVPSRHTSQTGGSQVFLRVSASLCLETTLLQGVTFDGCRAGQFISPPRGGGTQIWFGQGCAAEAAKPVPIFKGHFGGKGYPLLGVFIQENYVFVYFSDEMGENM